MNELFGERDKCHLCHKLVTFEYERIITNNFPPAAFFLSRVEQSKHLNQLFVVKKCKKKNTTTQCYFVFFLGCLFRMRPFLSPHACVVGCRVECVRGVDDVSTCVPRTRPADVRPHRKRQRQRQTLTRVKRCRTGWSALPPRRHRRYRTIPRRCVNKRRRQTQAARTMREPPSPTSLPPAVRRANKITAGAHRSDPSGSPLPPSSIYFDEYDVRAYWVGGWRAWYYLIYCAESGKCIMQEETSD